MNFKTIFFNEFGRFRSGWRFTFFLLSYLLVAYMILIFLLAILSALPIGLNQTSLLYFIFPFAVFSLVAVFFGWLYGKIFEDLPFRALGCWFTKNWFKDLILGLIAGALSLSLAVLIPLISGGLNFEFNHTAGTTPILLTLSVTLLIFTVAAISEEVLFRGYLLQTMSRAKLFLVGALLTSLLFASAHNNNPGANLFSWVNTFIAGLWFAVAYFKTRDLWFPFGIHLAWNWFQGSIFGISVSGLGELASAPLMKPADSGPAWLTGGAYGIEGGIACTMALVVSVALIYFLPIFKPSEEMVVFSSEEKPKPGSAMQG
jgi:membrane protease YdiL (CAAX protease family)